MPNKNLLRFLKPDVKLSSNGFDLSHRDVFSIKAGALNVAMYLPCVQGDYHEISPVSYISTMPFNVANFTRMKQHLDFYFVPYTAIQSRFLEWYQQTTDPSNAWQQLNNSLENDDDFVAYVSLQKLVFALCYASAFDHSHEIAAALDDFQIQTQEALNSVGLQLMSSIIHDFPQGIDDLVEIFVGHTDPTDPNFRELRKDKLGYPIYLNTIRLLDMLGYGNFLPLIKLPIFTGGFSVIGDYNLPQYYEEALESMAHDFQASILPSLNVDVSLYNLAAYQCVCQNYYINTFYERPDVACYNFDDLITSGDVINQRSQFVEDNGLVQLFTQNYRPWKKDLFLSALPSPQFGNVSVATVLSDRLSKPDGTFPTAGSGLLTKSQGKFGVNSSELTLTSSLSVLDLRRAEALQYWREQIGRAGFRYSDRFRATFGDKPGFDPKIMPVPIGSFVSDINKDPVVGTAGESFGDKRATGSSLLQNETIKFEAPSFGVIIGLMSVLPESDYDSFMVDKNNTKFSPFEFFTPALQNLGFVPVNIRELSIYTDDNYSSNSATIGYVPSYYEHKTAIDKVHGEFCSMPLMLMRSLSTSPIGQFSSFVSTRIDMESYSGSVRQYYVDPAVLDNIFLNAADDEQSSDQFHVSCYFDIKSYRPMSILGLPQF